MEMTKTNKKKGTLGMFTGKLVEIEKGVFENQDATAPKSDKTAAHYRESAIRILDDDLYHYQCMARKFADWPIFTDEFYSVADIAGGHPKLASFMNVVEKITVYDQYASTYKKTHGEFLKRYPTKAEVVYEKKTVTHPNFTPNGEVAILCHILEHLSIAQIRRLLANLETDKVVIYGPNIAKAKSAGWFHFRPDDHRTFVTLDAMCALVAEAGFVVKKAVGYHEDYLIYGDK
jgi:hypothetical protein